MMLLLDPLLQAVLSSAFALLFSLAALHKWRNRSEFLNVLEQYAVPSVFRRPAHLALASLESMLAVALLLPESRAMAAATGIVLLLIYTSVLAFTLYRGRELADCGCSFGPPQVLDGTLVLRNLLLAGLATPLLMTPIIRSMGWTDAVIGILALVVASLLYTTVQILLANQPRTRELTHA